jgi:hypothetical protein
MAKLRSVIVHQSGIIHVANGINPASKPIAVYDLDDATAKGAKIVGEPIRIGPESLLLTIEEPDPVKP